MKIIEYKAISELDALGEPWDRLGAREARFFTSFSEFRYGLEASGSKFRILVAVDDSQVVGIACFVYRNTRKTYAIAERKLFDLPIKEVSLFGSCVLGQVDEVIIKDFFKLVINDSNFDLMSLGEIIIDTPLYKAVTKLRGGVIVGRVTREDSIRWLIKLPESFDDYCKSLGPATRKKDVGRFKKVERQTAFEVHVIHRPDQIGEFLQDGERVSRLTFQWNLGTRLCNDKETQQRLVRLAQKGQLRCYIAYFEGRPCAFAYGELSHRIYFYQNAGYDPKYVNESPGTALMLWVIRDLINNTDCEVFDFGMGNYEYKQRFGNTSLNCARLQIGRVYRPYSVFVVALDQILNVVKNLVSSVVGRSKLLQYLKRATRQYGGI
jgi:hypothetical protein